MNISPNPPANIYSSPVTPHPPGQVVTTLLGLHKDDGFVLFLSHDLLHQLNESVDGGREATTHQKPQKNSEDNNRFCYNIAAIQQQNVSLLLVLFRFQADVNNLQDVVVGTELQSTNINLDVLLQEVLSQLPYLFWPGCTPHQGLSVRLRGGREY